MHQLIEKLSIYDLINHQMQQDPAENSDWFNRSFVIYCEGFNKTWIKLTKRVKKSNKFILNRCLLVNLSLSYDSKMQWNQKESNQDHKTGARAKIQDHKSSDNADSSGNSPFFCVRLLIIINEFYELNNTLLKSWLLTFHI